MSEINFNSIFDGVSLALHAAFPDRQVHGGSVKQGLNDGDFNVFMPGVVNAKEVGSRYRRTPTVDVIYYPRDRKRLTAECYDMAQHMAQVLESIVTPEGDTVHATSMEFQTTDDVLHMIAHYDHFARIVPEPVMMETLQVKQEG